jgi:hypothetical protein
MARSVPFAQAPTQHFWEQGISFSAGIAENNSAPQQIQFYIAAGSNSEHGFFWQKC